MSLLKSGFKGRGLHFFCNGFVHFCQLFDRTLVLFDELIIALSSSHKKMESGLVNFINGLILFP